MSEAVVHKPLRVALYARISQDESGQALGVTRQLDECRQKAEQNGWTVVAELQDNDISAYSGKVRPGYDTLCHLVATHQLDAVLVYHLSRLWRSRPQRSAGIELFKRSLIQVVAVSGPALDMSTAYGRGMADVLGSFDTMESDVKSERVASAALQRAERGDPNGAIPYGWKRVIETDGRGRRIGAHDIKHPEEAPIVEEICRRLLARESLVAVTRWLNDQGYPPPGVDFELKERKRGLDNPDGTRWAKTTVKKVALRAQNCGLRFYHQGRRDQRLLPMKAEPIISREQWEDLRAILLAPDRSRNNGGARRYLLSHNTVGRCGVCQGPLRHSIRRRQSKTKGLIEHHLYVCDTPAGCVGRDQRRVDEWVAARVAARLSQPDARDLLVRDDSGKREALEELDRLRRRLDVAADLYADGTIDEEALARISKELRPRIETARQKAQALSPAVPHELLEAITADNALAVWQAMRVTQQLALLEFLNATVTINRRTKGGPGFEPETVDVVFRGV